jgi:hypothetical protein
MNKCTKCNKKGAKRFYKIKQICGSCFNKNTEKNRIKKECKYCKKNKICRYAGPCCATCYSKYLNKNYYDKTLERNKSRSYLSSNRFSCAKSEAKRRKIRWSIDLEDYNKLINLPCHYCNSQNKSTGTGLDRIINDKNIGYTKENVLPCCGSCNQIRGDHLTVEEMEFVIKCLIEFRNKKILIGRKELQEMLNFDTIIDAETALELNLIDKIEDKNG